MTPALSWLGILRLGLVQTSLGAVVVLTTSAINRVMVIELALPATLPGLLVGLHYAVQLMRPRMGHGSDVGGRRTPWIVGGMALLALGGVGAAAATALMGTHLVAGIAAAFVAFVAIGLGVGAAGTSLLALLAARTAPARRPAAASVVWIMMIAGFVVTTATSGALLDPYSPGRLVAVFAGVSALAFVLALAAVWGMEPARAAPVGLLAARNTDFRAALGEAWADPDARRFTLFVFASMLAYSAQDLLLEPFAGVVFGMTLGETTKLSSVQSGGVLAGMILVALLGGTGLGRPREMTIVGCVAAAFGAASLVVGALAPAGFPLSVACFLLGIANGAFAASAIAAMMALAGGGRGSREGVRLGLWGAAQAIAFGLGGLVGTVAVDVARWATGSASAAYALAFAGDAALFLVSAALALGIGRAASAPRPGDAAPLPRGGLVTASGD